VCVCWPDGCKYFLFRLTWLSAKKFWVVHEFFSPFFFSTCTLQVVRPSTTRAYSVSKLFLFFFRFSSRRSRLWQKCLTAQLTRFTMPRRAVAERPMVGEREKKLDHFFWRLLLLQKGGGETSFYPHVSFTYSLRRPTLCTRLILVTWKMFKAFSNCPY
jgi:hypothetical protein